MAQRRSSNAGLILVAAAIVLVVGLGLVFRGAIGEFLLRSDDPATAATPPASNLAAPPALDSSSASSAASTDTPAGSTDAGDSQDAQSGSDAASWPKTTLAANGDADARESLPVEAGDAQIASALAANTDPAPAAGDRRERIADAIADRREQRREVAAAAAPAKVAPPVRPAPPRVVVIGVGDPALTDAAKQKIEERLHAEGIEILDTGIAGVDGRSDLPGLFADLRREATILIMVRADPLGSQQLNYYGQSSTLYSANLSVRAYHIGDKRPLGPGFREKVDFTNLNVDENTGLALRAHMAQLMREAAEARRRGAG